MGNELNAALTAALPLIESLFALGVPGILLFLASIPAMAVALVFILDYRHGKRIERVLAAYRKDTQEGLRTVSEKHEAILREVIEKHEETAEFYRKNVTLVKNYERMNDTLQTLVVNNTRAMEHLSTIIEARNRCVAWKKWASGRSFELDARLSLLKSSRTGTACCRPCPLSTRLTSLRESISPRWVSS